MKKITGLIIFLLAFTTVFTFSFDSVKAKKAGTSKVQSNAINKTNKQLCWHKYFWNCYKNKKQEFKNNTVKRYNANWQWEQKVQTTF